MLDCNWIISENAIVDQRELVRQYINQNSMKSKLLENKKAVRISN
jgi:hypothetical protein